MEDMCAGLFMIVKKSILFQTRQNVISNFEFRAAAYT